MKKTITIIFIAAVILAGAAGGYLWYSGRYDRYIAQANASYTASQYQDAANYYQKAYDTKSDSVDAVIGLARSGKASGNKEMADMNYQKYMEYRPTDEEPYLYFAENMIRENNLPGAIDILKNGREKTGGQQVSNLLYKVLVQNGDALYQAGNYQGAIENYDSASKVNADSAEAILGLARSNVKMGSKENANTFIRSIWS